MVDAEKAIVYHEAMMATDRRRVAASRGRVWPTDPCVSAAASADDGTRP